MRRCKLRLDLYSFLHLADCIRISFFTLIKHTQLIVRFVPSRSSRLCSVQQFLDVVEIPPFYSALDRYGKVHETVELGDLQIVPCEVEDLRCR